MGICRLRIQGYLQSFTDWLWCGEFLGGVTDAPEVPIATHENTVAPGGGFTVAQPEFRFAVKGDVALYGFAAWWW